MPAKDAKVPAKAAARGTSELRRADASDALPPEQPEQIRNVALVGHSGAGKTMLAEALLAATGAISRKGSITEGTTVSDSEPAAIHQQRSVALSVVPVVAGGIKVNLLDTPGYPDFVGELRAGLRAADAALFVVSAVDDIDAATTALWGECQRVGVPRAVVISRLDHPRADFDAALEQVPAGFRRHGAAALPSGARNGAERHRTAGPALGHRVGTAGGCALPVYRNADDVERVASEAARGALIEGIIAESEDESLMDRYLGGEEIPPEVLVGDLETAVARGSFHPVIATSAETGVGLAELLEVVARAFPPPTEHARAGGDPPRRHPRRHTGLRPRGAAARRGGAHHASTRSWAGSAWSASFPARCARTRPSTWPGTAWRTGATSTTTATSVSPTCIRRWDPACGRCRTAWRGTSAP